MARGRHARATINKDEYKKSEKFGLIGSLNTIFVLRTSTYQIENCWCDRKSSQQQRNEN
jgi:hypothetical protein